MIEIMAAGKVGCMAAVAAAEGRKKTSSQKQKEEEKRARTAQLNAQKDSLGSRLAAVDALRSGFTIPVLEGEAVEHTQYGPGKILQQQGAVITVQYGDLLKKQKLPFVVAGGLMHLQDEETEKSLTQMEDLDRQKDALEKEIHYIESLLGDLEKAD